LIKIQRITEDSSWHLQWDDTSILIDPWLIGPEIDGFSWLNKQWHTTEPLKINDLPAYGAILVSQSYEDHCHLLTLRNLDPEKLIFASPRAYSKIKKTLKNRNVNVIDENNVVYKNLHFSSFRPNRIMDPIYYGILIVNSENEAIFYCPHGFALSEEQLEKIKSVKVKLLITTFTDFKLPAILGGRVNPGMDQVKQLVDQLTPETVLNTHDEVKIMQGIVAKTAKIEFADYDKLEKNGEFNYVKTDGYNPLCIE